jgi:hypothetical protein
MQKIQILFPDPMMGKLREVSEQQDIPISEIVRGATAMWLDRMPAKLPTRRKKVPVVDAGRCLLGGDEMKEALYE